MRLVGLLVEDVVVDSYSVYGFDDTVGYLLLSETGHELIRENREIGGSLQGWPRPSSSPPEI